LVVEADDISHAAAVVAGVDEVAQAAASSIGLL